MKIVLDTNILLVAFGKRNRLQTYLAGVYRKPITINSY